MEDEEVQGFLSHPHFQSLSMKGYSYDGNQTAATEVVATPSEVTSTETVTCPVPPPLSIVLSEAEREELAQENASLSLAAALARQLRSFADCGWTKSQTLAQERGMGTPPVPNGGPLCLFLGSVT
jgi:hypothetical protein